MVRKQWSKRKFATRPALNRDAFVNFGAKVFGAVNICAPGVLAALTAVLRCRAISGRVLLQMLTILVMASVTGQIEGAAFCRPGPDRASLHVRLGHSGS